MTELQKQEQLANIADALNKVEETKTSVKKIVGCRETSSAITKLDCARHWLRDLKEIVEQTEVED